MLAFGNARFWQWQPLSGGLTYSAGLMVSGKIRLPSGKNSFLSVAVNQLGTYGNWGRYIVLIYYRYKVGHSQYVEGAQFDHS